MESIISPSAFGSGGFFVRSPVACPLDVVRDRPAGGRGVVGGRYGGGAMTVCIAALCSDGEEPRAVVAADRMVTLGSFIEFEHAVSKIASASPFALAMVAGDALVGARIAKAVQDSAAGTSPAVADVAQELANQYLAAREEQLNEQLLLPRGLNLQSFYNAHAALNPQITAMLDNQMAQFNLGVELLLAGVDPSGAHLHTIQNPGGSDRLHDQIGYAAIGSGAIHALQSMIGFGHCSDADYHQTVFRVYASKRRSEVAPGVGQDTDMAVISGAGTHWLSDDELDQLRVIFEDFESSTDKTLKAKLADFSLDEGAKNE